VIVGQGVDEAPMGTIITSMPLSGEMYTVERNVRLVNYVIILFETVSLPDSVGNMLLRHDGHYRIPPLISSLEFKAISSTSKFEKKYNKSGTV
jgi:hypothetical protein